MKSITRQTALLLICLTYFLLLAGIALAMSSDNYAINWYAMDGGGRPTNSDNYSAQSILGQTAIGTSSSASYSAAAGYSPGIGQPPLPPTISFNPPSFSFSATEGEANPPDQTLEIWNSGGGTLDWSVSENATWLILSPGSGTSNGEHDSITVSVSIVGMTAGNYSSTITIIAVGATNTPQTVLVNLTVIPPTGEDNPPVAVGFASILDKLDIAYGYKFGEGVGGWTVFNPAWASAHPEWNTLTMLYKGRGYWIKLSEACTLTCGDNTYGLDEGWNLIGWLGY